MKFENFKIGKLNQMFRRRPERLGVAIEERSIRIVRLKRRDDDLCQIAVFGELDIDLWHAGAMEQQRLRSAIRQLGEGMTRVAVGIEHPTLRIRRMSFAKMPEQDLLEAIRWNFRESVEGAIEQYLVGYTPLEGISEGGKLSIMAYGIAQEAIKEYSGLIKSAGMKAVSLEPKATALLAAFYANGILEDDKYHVCISFGNGTTHFIVMRGRSMLFSRPLAGIGHDALVKLVMRNLNLEEREARETLELWINVGENAPQAEAIDASGTSTRVRHLETTIGHFLSQLVIEVQRSIDAFCIMYGVERVSDIRVCGEGVIYPGLMSHMQRTLGIATTDFNPFERLLEPERQTPEVIRRAPLYATATGLAI